MSIQDAFRFREEYIGDKLPSLYARFGYARSLQVIRVVSMVEESDYRNSYLSFM